ncbi:MAG: hypothetical protein ACREDY_24235, partial [Bradyrhizobium sp.]
MSAALIAVAGTGTFWSEQRSYREAIQNAGAALEGTARSAEIGTGRSLLEIETMLAPIERIVDTELPRTPIDDRSLQTVLRQFNEQSPAQSLAVGDILILDANGRVVNRVNPVTETGSDGGRGRFVTAHQAIAPATLSIGAPELDPTTASWSVMARRPLRRDGATIGAIAVEVPITTFTDFYDAIQPSGGARIELLLDDGTLIASQPIQNVTIGAVPVFAKTLLAAAAGQRSGLIEGSEGAGKHVLLRAFRRVPGRALIVSVSRTRADILRRWYAECTIAAAAFGLFALIAA